MYHLVTSRLAIIRKEFQDFSLRSLKATFSLGYPIALQLSKGLFYRYIFSLHMFIVYPCFPLSVDPFLRSVVISIRNSMISSLLTCKQPLFYSNVCPEKKKICNIYKYDFSYLDLHHFVRLAARIACLVFLKFCADVRFFFAELRN